jgi:DNA-binding NarL/FixJ family response regulator
MLQNSTSSAKSCDAKMQAVLHFCQRAGMSTREQQVIQLAVSGRADKEISAELELAYSTVKSYWSRICFKLSVPNKQLAISKLILDLAVPTRGSEMILLNHRSTQHSQSVFKKPQRQDSAT